MAEIRFIKKSEWLKLRAFNEAEYKPGHILTNKVYYDWQFDNFANPNKDAYGTLGLFNSSGELIGTFGLFYAPMHFFGRTLMGTHLCNLIIKKDLRSLGYGYRLLERAASLNPLALDHTINEAAWPMFMRSGWQGENLKRFIFIINSKTSLYQLPASREAPPVRSWEWIVVSEFDEKIDVFWQSIRERYPITVERTANYLNWRYSHDPLIKYKAFLARDGGLVKALVILRIEEPRDEKQPLGIRVGRIIDFVSDKGADIFALTQTIRYCRDEGIAFIDYFLSGDFYDQSLAAAGFINGDSPEYKKIPILFIPVSTKRLYLNFAVQTADPSLKDKVKDLKNWYTTKGGGDQDRAY